MPVILKRHFVGQQFTVHLVFFSPPNRKMCIELFHTMSTN